MSDETPAATTPRDLINQVWKRALKNNPEAAALLGFVWDFDAEEESDGSVWNE